MIAVFEVLGRTQIAGLDDAALVGECGLHVVDAVDGNGVELLGSHH